MRELGVSGDVVAVDRLGTPGFLALQAQGIRFVDSAPATQEAREVKTPEEIRLFEINGAMVVDMLAAFEAALVPGVRERDLLAVLSDTMLRARGRVPRDEHGVLRAEHEPLAVGGDRSRRSSRATSCSSTPTPSGSRAASSACRGRSSLATDARRRAQRDTYRASLEWLEGMKAVVRPGLTCGEIADLAPPLPEKYLPQRYECMIHGIGLEEESPSVCYPIDRQSNGERVIREDMAFVIELYAGEVGGDHGVKLGDEVLVTRDGVRVLAPYPFSAVFA